MPHSATTPRRRLAGDGRRATAHRGARAPAVRSRHDRARELHSEVFAETRIEALLEASEPGLLDYCLDVGLHACGGGDPVAFMRTHHARIPTLHLTNIDGAVAERVRSQRVPFDEAVGLGLFREPGDGAVDYPALAAVLAEVGYEGWAIAEHPSTFAEPLPPAKRAREYFRHIGID